MTTELGDLVMSLRNMRAKAPRAVATARQRKAKRKDDESKWAEKTKEVKDVVLFIEDRKGDWHKSAKETSRREKAPVQQPREVGTQVTTAQGSLEELKLLNAGRKR